MSIDQKIIDQYLAISGKVRGVVFETDAKYVVLNWGNEGLDKLNKAMRDYGVDIDYNNAHTVDWFPVGYRMLSIKVIKEVFNLNNEYIRDIGYTAPKLSRIVRFSIRFFLNFEKFVGRIPTMWKQHYTTGSLEVIKSDETSKELIIVIKDLYKHLDTIDDPDKHLFVTSYLEGYFEKVSQFMKNELKGTMNITEYNNEQCYKFYGRW